MIRSTFVNAEERKGKNEPAIQKAINPICQLKTAYSHQNQSSLQKCQKLTKALSYNPKARKLSSSESLTRTAVNQIANL